MQPSAKQEARPQSSAEDGCRCAISVKFDESSKGRVEDKEEYPCVGRGNWLHLIMECTDEA